MGPVPQRAAVGNGPRGLQRERRRLEFLHPRPGPLARLSLGRRRAGRHLRRQAAPLLRAGPVEREGSDPQGAALRIDQQRGQPRRGCEGVLLLPRQHADPLVHEVLSTSTRRRRFPTAIWWRPTAGVPARSSSTSCSTPASSRTTGTSTSSWSTPKAARKTSSSRSRRPTGDRKPPNCTSCRRCGSGTTGRRGLPHPTGPRRSPLSGRSRRRQARVRWRQRIRPRRVRLFLRRQRAAAVHRERNQPRAALSGAEERERLRQGRHQRLRRPRQPGCREPRQGRAPRSRHTTRSPSAPVSPR